MSASGDDLRRLREKRGLTQKEMAGVFNAALGRSYTSGSVSPWEQGKRPMPKDVQALLEELIVDANLGSDEPIMPPDETAERPSAAGDVPPPGPGPQPLPEGQPPLGSGGVWNRACVELWELIATGVGMVGAATGNQGLMVDGAIIDADKEALGAAWGKLAETNETFRRMLVGMTEGGAWLQVALVTGTTVSKCWQNHAALQLAAASNGYAAEPVAA